MLDYSSYKIGQAVAFVGSVMSNLTNRVCGSVYRYNDANRNNALMLNGQGETKYPTMSSMIWKGNIGEYVYVNHFDTDRPVMSQFPDDTLYDYTYDNSKYTDSSNPTVKQRMEDALKYAEYSLQIKDMLYEIPVENTDDFRKFSEDYTTDSDSTFLTTDGTLLKGRLVYGLLSTLGIGGTGYTSISADNDINKVDSLRRSSKMSDIIQPLRTYGPFQDDEVSFYSTSDDPTTFNEPIRINPTVAKYALQGRYEGITETLDRLSKVYTNTQVAGTHGFKNISSQLMAIIIETLGNSLTEENPYITNGTGHDVKGDVLYGVDSDEWKSGFEEGMSVTIGNYSDGKGQMTETDYSNVGHSRTYDLYSERSDGDEAHVLNTGSNADGNLSESYVPFNLSGETDLDSSCLLAKTNRLFNQGKIGSLINRFHTKTLAKDEMSNAVDNFYGMSRGRNLRKDSETQHYGYDNPYCRVWTSIHQYSKFTNLIRPFTQDGKFMTPDETRSNLGGINSDHTSNLANYGVMQKIGLPRIAPHSDDASVKRCMFSIENLAWKDINFNAKIDATKHTVLSKEQQGPNGGRIMWFPPYNLKFTENVGVNWNPNNFIGRGEQIYTYTNTERSGTLNFTLLVDHPSIVDKWAQPIANATMDNEHSLLKFFAGCDILVPDDGEKQKNTAEVAAANEPAIPSTPAPSSEEGAKEDRYYVFFPNDFSGIDYITQKGKNVKTAMMYLINGYDGAGYEMSYTGGVDGCINAPTYVCTNKNGKSQTWYYQPDERCQKEVLRVGDGLDNYKDTISYKLNYTDSIPVIRDIAYNQAETPNGQILKKDFGFDVIPSGNVFSFVDLCSIDNLYAGMFEGTSPDGLNYDVSVEVKGYASSHGYNTSNTTLSDNRAKVIASFIKGMNVFPEDTVRVVDSGTISLSAGNYDVNSFEAKAARSVEVVVRYSLKSDVDPVVNSTEEGTKVTVETRTSDAAAAVQATSTTSTGTTIIPDDESFDNEYNYFRQIADTAPLVRKNIAEKVHYFDPAFHSITPEGFNSRLSFLHQCTRQGPTSAVGERQNTENGKVDVNTAAGNLSFGRPPICVLRIGDFYNTKIIIDSVSIDYDNGGGVQWDMNPEGIGLQPMFANVSIGFKFLGGSDITGPIERLQNAVSSNFYANESIYNDRSDYRTEDGVTMAWTPTYVGDSANTANHFEFRSSNDDNYGKTSK